MDIPCWWFSSLADPASTSRCTSVCSGAADRAGSTRYSRPFSSVPRPMSCRSCSGKPGPRGFCGSDAPLDAAPRSVRPLRVSGTLPARSAPGWAREGGVGRQRSLIAGGIRVAPRGRVRRNAPVITRRLKQNSSRSFIDASTAFSTGKLSGVPHTATHV